MISSGCTTRKEQNLFYFKEKKGKKKKRFRLKPPGSFLKHLQSSAARSKSFPFLFLPRRFPTCMSSVQPNPEVPPVLWWEQLPASPSDHHWDSSLHVGQAKFTHHQQKVPFIPSVGEGEQNTPELHNRKTRRPQLYSHMGRCVKMVQTPRKSLRKHCLWHSQSPPHAPAWCQ